MKPVRVAVLAFDGISLFHLSVPGLVFGIEPAPPGLSPHAVIHCAEAPGEVRTSQGISINVPCGLEAMRKAAIVIVPSWSAPDTPASPAVVEALLKAHRRGAQIVGLCLGAFVLGDAGLLDGRQATTHWAARDVFARRFPAADFRPEVLYVADDNVVTSAGTAAAIDCCLNLVRQRDGADVANRVARMLVTPPHRQGGQAQFIEQPVPELPSEHRLPGVLEWAMEHLSEPLSVDLLADAARMSRRTFTRRFREATGTTVSKWVANARLARAQQLLETTELPVERIATEVGFGTALSLRQNFSEQFGSTPSEYRRTFSGRPFAA
ncbi:transcriptional regulator GlxA family with amidase domain [Luteimonas cucumeris]|uniref:Transcriptional regulator GlxA family with amidase domain n=1 Tax=Luteimonas cucumeris TaxID=985012 RepID=A0A562KXV8_9GAMM|nr:helix-turn-helix domain-containing protein [Luteimonas cucumeris]TWI00252.1 transcriptional regulator GlxA family with amidase domain [Luteimonas cucumeris]